MSPIREVERRKRVKTPLQPITFSVTLTLSPRQCRALVDIGQVSKLEPKVLAAWVKAVMQEELDQSVMDAEEADKAEESYQ